MSENHELEARKAVGKKILAIMEEVAYIQKKGKNQAQHYNYVMEADVMAEVGPLCVKHGLAFLPCCTTEQHEVIDLGKDRKPYLLTKVCMDFEIVDVDTGFSVIKRMVGYGADNQDKGVFKAITGATKYLLMKTLLLSSGDDPEKDEKSTISPHSEAIAPDTLLEAIILDYEAKQGEKPHKIRVALQDGDMTFTQHRLPCSEALLANCLGRQVKIRYRKQGKFYELMEIQPEMATPASELAQISTEPEQTTQPSDGWLQGQIKAYGTKEGTNKNGNPYTMHKLDFMEDSGAKIHTTCFSLSALSPDAGWTPELLDIAVEERTPVQFVIETSEKGGRQFHNLIALEVAP